MGRDLNLIILDDPADLQKKAVFEKSVLRFERRTELFERIDRTIKTETIPAQLWLERYDEDGIERFRDDRNGQRLTFVYAQTLKRLEVTKEDHPRNLAIKAFIDALPNDTPLIFEWSG